MPRKSNEQKILLFGLRGDERSFYYKHFKIDKNRKRLISFDRALDEAIKRDIVYDLICFLRANTDEKKSVSSLRTSHSSDWKDYFLTSQFLTMVGATHGAIVENIDDEKVFKNPMAIIILAYKYILNQPDIDINQHIWDTLELALTELDNGQQENEIQDYQWQIIRREVLGIKLRTAPPLPISAEPDPINNDENESKDENEAVEEEQDENNKWSNAEIRCRSKKIAEEFEKKERSAEKRIEIDLSLARGDVIQFPEFLSDIIQGISKNMKKYPFLHIDNIYEPAKCGFSEYMGMSEDIFCALERIIRIADCIRSVTKESEIENLGKQYMDYVKLSVKEISYKQQVKEKQISYYLLEKMYDMEWFRYVTTCIIENWGENEWKKIKPVKKKILAGYLKEVRLMKYSFAKRIVAEIMIQYFRQKQELKTRKLKSKMDNRYIKIRRELKTKYSAMLINVIRKESISLEDLYNLMVENDECWSWYRKQEGMGTHSLSILDWVIGETREF